jgi:hypothetical protein
MVKEKGRKNYCESRDYTTQVSRVVEGEGPANIIAAGWASTRTQPNSTARHIPVEENHWRPLSPVLPAACARGLSSHHHHYIMW